MFFLSILVIGTVVLQYAVDATRSSSRVVEVGMEARQLQRRRKLVTVRHPKLLDMLEYYNDDENDNHLIHRQSSHNSDDNNDKIGQRRRMTQLVADGNSDMIGPRRNSTSAGEYIPDEYIIVLYDDDDDDQKIPTTTNHTNNSQFVRRWETTSSSSSSNSNLFRGRKQNTKRESEKTTDTTTESTNGKSNYDSEEDTKLSIIQSLLQSILDDTNQLLINTRQQPKRHEIRTCHHRPNVMTRSKDVVVRAEEKSSDKEEQDEEERMMIHKTSHHNNNNNNNATIRLLYTSSIQGGLVTNMTIEHLQQLLDDERVKYVTRNKRVGISCLQQTTATTSSSNYMDGEPRRILQSNETGEMIQNLTSTSLWHLDRIDQCTFPLDMLYKYNCTGRGVTAFVLDTGILANHSEFMYNHTRSQTIQSRVSCGYNVWIEIDGGLSHVRENCTDNNGHGTSVASAMGAKTYGVAKRLSRIVNVKVLDKTGDGTVATVIAGIVCVIRRRKREMSTKPPNATRPMVLNMSVLTSIVDQAFNDVTTKAANAGIIVTVPSGNGFGQDSCHHSPSSTIAAVTVGATELGRSNSSSSNSTTTISQHEDYVASYSNTGPCVDIYAPGSHIIVASHKCTTCSVLVSGTSIAAPIVAGVAALHYQLKPSYDPFQIKDMIQQHATRLDHFTTSTGHTTKSSKVTLSPYPYF